MRKLPRLSLDIDLVYVRSYRKEDIVEDRERVEEKLSDIFQYFGYDVERVRHYALDQYLLTQV